MSDQFSKSIDLFEEQHGFRFHDRMLLQTAFTHSSYVNESSDNELSDNERLEFLGDSILEFVVSEILYMRFPEASEGVLTGMRAALVRRETLARFARQLHLGDFLMLGHGEEESGGRKRPATLCATFEAVIGAMYLDLGVEAVRRFVEPFVEADLDRVQGLAARKDPKSRLQEWAQGNFGLPPRYRVVDSTGPDHDKEFVTQVTISDGRYGIGVGRSKQESSQAAAAMALDRLGLDAPEYEPNPEIEAQYPLSDDLTSQ